MMPRKRQTLGMLLTALLSLTGQQLLAATPKEPRTFELTTQETLQVARLNEGDTLHFQLKNGQTRSFVMEKATARIVERPTGGIVYSFDCRLLADGEPLTLRRYVCSQETFYEPWVVNGVRLWLSSSAAVFNLVPIRNPNDHDSFDADAIVVLQDATLPICPEALQPWFSFDRPFIDIGTCYNGDDPFLGAYLGQAGHVGLDINMPKGTPLYAPIGFDSQWIFSSNHRWRGVRKWPNGDVWVLQSHHVDKLLVRENTRLPAGTHYAEGAGKGVGLHEHSHFEFHIGPTLLDQRRSGGSEIDPWIFFWQMFEIHKTAQGIIHAEIAPLSPTTTGQAVSFSAQGSRPGKEGRELRMFWTFGDGRAATGTSPSHVFTQPGVYPVTLIVDDGHSRATRTQHITVTGKPMPSLTLDAPNNRSYHPRPAAVADVYGWPIRSMPHTLRFAARPAAASPPAQQVRFKSTTDGSLIPAKVKDILYVSVAPESGGSTQSDWLVLSHDGPDDHELLVTCKSHQLPLGRHEAIVTLESDSQMPNNLHCFRVEVTVRPSPQTIDTIVDDTDDGFEATPFAWVGHQFSRCPERGYQNRYLTNGGISAASITARFTPDLAAGDYEVLLHPETPLGTTELHFRIHHANGEQTIRFSPQEHLPTARSLGKFTFAEGTAGFVELLTEDAQGSVIADAIIFRRQ